VNAKEIALCEKIQLAVFDLLEEATPDNQLSLLKQVIEEKGKKMKAVRFRILDDKLAVCKTGILESGDNAVATPKHGHIQVELTKGVYVTISSLIPSYLVMTAPATE